MRKNTQKPNGMRKDSRSTTKYVNRSNVVIDIDRYSGPEPQILPCPPELVVRILGYLDQACDKRSARLVCKGFAAAGLPSLTSTVYFSPSLIGIDYSSKVPHCSSPTLELAMHPVVSKYVTTLVCEGTRLSAGFLTVVPFQKCWARLKKDQTSWTVEQIHSLYTSRYKQEKWMVDTGEDRKIFCAALAYLPNLKCIVFRDLVTNQSDRDWPRPPWPSAAPEGDLWGPTSPYHNFAMCIRSLSKMGIKPRELHITGRDAAISHGVFLHASPKDYNHLLNVFASLRKVSVNITPHHVTYPLCFPGLGRLLTHATSLQSLELFCSGNKLDHARLNLARLFRTFTWPSLKHFGLSGVKMNSAAEMIAFFERHRGTIDSVSLSDMYLHQKDWDNHDASPCQAWKHFFEELRKRSVKFRYLYLFRICDCGCHARGDTELHVLARFGEGVLRYLSEGGPNPLSVETVEGGGGSRCGCGEPSGGGNMFLC